ncbi:MAG: DUF4430 domain-containing protein [Fastidiosipila sp.]|nr:DUF4430 domain-containing protein [Fastidiosipila sp.]
MNGNYKKKNRTKKLTIISLLLILILSISFLNACTPKNSSPEASFYQPSSEKSEIQTHKASTNSTEKITTEKTKENVTEDPDYSKENSITSVTSESSSAVSEQVTTKKQTTKNTTTSKTSKAKTSASTKTAATTTSTTSSTTTKAATTTTTTPDGKITVYLTINCVNAVNANLSAAASYAPDGIMMSNKELSVKQGSTVLDVLNVLKESGYVISASNNFLGTYVSAIQGISSGAASGSGGWIFSVNGNFPNTSASNLIVTNGDRISFHYTIKTGDVPGSPY